MTTERAYEPTEFADRPPMAAPSAWRVDCSLCDHGLAVAAVVAREDAELVARVHGWDVSTRLALCPACASVRAPLSTIDDSPTEHDENH